MKSQKEIFKEGEGDSWFDRNKQAAPRSVEQDQAIRLLKSSEITPKRVLEIGCSSGARLNLLRHAFGSECSGVDPSLRAIEDGRRLFPELALETATADSLPFADNSFDTIIFGFCLYLCDRSDLFRIACEADRCLQDGGSLIITDFCPPFPYKNGYSHFEGVNSFKMDYSRMFSWNPAYYEAARVVYSHSGFEQIDVPDERVASILLRKAEKQAYPEAPFA